MELGESLTEKLVPRGKEIIKLLKFIHKEILSHFFFVCYET